MVAVQEGKVVHNLGAKAKGPCWIARESNRAGLSNCLRIYVFFAVVHTLGLRPHRLLDSVRTLVGAKPARPKASSVAHAVQQCSCRAILDHGSFGGPVELGPRGKPQTVRVLAGTSLVTGQTGT